jgi:hypothetical protein
MRECIRLMFRGVLEHLCHKRASNGSGGVAFTGRKVRAEGCAQDGFGESGTRCGSAFENAANKVDETFVGRLFAEDM